MSKDRFGGRERGGRHGIGKKDDHFPKKKPARYFGDSKLFIREVSEDSEQASKVSKKKSSPKKK